METPSYRVIEDDFRAFLYRVTVELVKQDTSCLRNLRPPVPNLNALQYKDYCDVILSIFPTGAQGFKPAQTERCTVDPSRRAELLYCKALRNKYAHPAGDAPFLSKEQLSDMLVVQRVVKALVPILPMQEENDAFVERVDEQVRHLMSQAAEVVLPDMFETIEEAEPLSETQLLALREMIAAAVRDGSAQVDGPNTRVSAPVAELSASLAQVQAGLHRLEERTGLLAGLPSRVDELNSAAQVHAASIQGAIADLRRHLSSEGGRMIMVPAPNGDIIAREWPSSSDELGGEVDTKREMEPAAPLSQEDARDQLISLRKRIWQEVRTGASPHGLLRRPMMEAFLYYLPRSESEARGGPMRSLMQSVSADEAPYLTDVIEILRRVPQSEP